MPVYEFECSRCSGRFELLIGINRIHEAKCPTCGSSKINRLISTFASRTADSECCDSSADRCSGCSSGNCATCGGC
ncbi:MAG: zinc ribbon domain-containing protein [Armatimonadetes bacterium]|nr:zinc ribbon domain-containing protein [Armatimonadota bacterium]